MVLLNFTLSPASCVRLYDALNCLSRFSDLVCLEARIGQVYAIQIPFSDVPNP